MLYVDNRPRMRLAARKYQLATGNCTPQLHLAFSHLRLSWLAVLCLPSCWDW